MCWRETPERSAGPPRCGRADFRASSSTTRFVLVDRAVDAVDLVGGDDVGRHALLELGEALVVAVLEGLEGAHEAVEGGGDVVAGRGGAGAGIAAMPLAAFVLDHLSLCKFAHVVPLLRGGRPAQLAVKLSKPATAADE